MGSPRAALAAQALERLYESRPADARAIERYLSDLKAEAARYRQRTRAAEAALAVQPRGQVPNPDQPGDARQHDQPERSHTHG